MRRGLHEYANVVHHHVDDDEHVIFSYINSKKLERPKNTNITPTPNSKTGSNFFI